MTGSDIDDAEAAVAQSDVGVNIVAGIVRAPMANGTGHSFEYRGRFAIGAYPGKSCDAAHILSLISLPGRDVYPRGRSSVVRTLPGWEYDAT